MLIATTMSDGRQTARRAMSEIHYEIQQLTDFRDLPEAPLETLWQEFGEEMDVMLRAMGGPQMPWKAHQDSFISNFEAFTPPHGGYYLAYDKQGDLLGHAAMRQVAPGIAEFKHMFVRSGTRGMGIGRALTVRRMLGAYELGCHTLTVDTFRDNTATRNLYESLGFQEVGPYAASGTVKTTPELAPFIVYYRLEHPERTSQQAEQGELGS